MVQPVICNSERKQPALPDYCSDGWWAIPVEDLSRIKEPNRDHAYILPDNSVWIVNHEGTGMIQLASSGEGGQPTLIKNMDGYIVVTGSGTHDVSLAIDYEKLMADFYTKAQIDSQLADKIDRAILIAEGQDLNGLNREGFYRCSLDAAAITLLNKPEELDQAIALLQHRNSNDGWRQIIYNSGSLIKWERLGVNGTWGAWKKSTQDLDLKQDKLTAGENITIKNNVISSTRGPEPVDAYSKEQSDNKFAEISKTQMIKITGDNGFSKRIATLNPIPTSMAELYKSVGEFYVTIAEAASFTDAAELPLQGYGWYVTNIPAHSSGIAGYQIIRPASTVKPRMFFRTVIASTGVISLWQKVANADLTQNSKITDDNGNTFHTVTADETILSYVISTGGVRSLQVPIGNADSPVTTQVFRYLQVMASQTHGFIIGTSDNNKGMYVRRIGGSIWQDNWTRIDKPATEQIIPTFADGFASYVSAENGTAYPCYIRKDHNGRCTMYGAIQNLVEKPVNMHALIATLPVGYRPIDEVRSVQQGSYAGSFLLTIRTNGNIIANRYRGQPEGNTILPVNTWFNTSNIYWETV